MEVVNSPFQSELLWLFVMGSEKNKDDKIAKFINYIHLRCIRLHCDDMYVAYWPRVLPS